MQLTQASIEFRLASIFTFGSTTATLPLTFSPIAPHFSRSRGTRHVLFILFLWIVTLDGMYQTYILISLHQLRTLPPLQELLTIITHSSSRIACLLGSWVVFANLNENLHAFSHTLTFYAKYKRKYFGQKVEPQRTVSNLLTYLAVIVRFQPLAPVIQHLQERHNFRYWGAHLPITFYDSPPGVALFVVLEMILSYFSVSAVLYFLIHLLIYTSSTRLWLSVISGRQMTHFHKTRSISCRLRMFKEMGILCAFHNAICGPLMWAISKHLLLTIHVIINVLLIRTFHSAPSYSLGVAISILAVVSFERVCFKSAAQVFELSKEFKMFLERSEVRTVRKVGRSLRCLRVQVASSYFFKMSTCNTFAQSVVDYTINLLIFLRESK